MAGGSAAPLGSLPDSEVADKCRYRYPNATERIPEMMPFPRRNRLDEEGGSGVADKRGEDPKAI